LLKGSGDFSPQDPIECPEDCEFVADSLAPSDCKNPFGCIYAEDQFKENY